MRRNLGGGYLLNNKGYFYSIVSAAYPKYPMYAYQTPTKAHGDSRYVQDQHGNYRITQTNR